jgi:hypothetical protein
MPPSGPTPASIQTSQILCDPFFELLYSSLVFLSFVVVVVVVSAVSRVRSEITEANEAKRELFPPPLPSLLSV